MKIHIAGIATETNTFAMAPTGLAAWEVDHGDGRSAEAQRWHEAGRRLAARDGHEVHFGLLAAAQPAGITVQSAYETLRDELLQRLQAVLPVNAVLLVLHGAMVAENCPDCEGDLIERVRALVGPGVPIGVELDLHCHFTERMRRNADIVIAYKEYPHTDLVERFEELWALILATAQGRVRPRPAGQSAPRARRARRAAARPHAKAAPRRCGRRRGPPPRRPDPWGPWRRCWFRWRCRRCGSS